MTTDLHDLSEKYRGVAAFDLLQAMIERQFAGRIALVSSFGADAAVLLHMVAKIDPATPVLFLDTHKLFAETKTYKQQLVTGFGLTDVRVISPLAENERDLDGNGVLWASEPGRCCYFRKVLPLQRALEGFDAWITGRKQYQNIERSQLPQFERADQRIKINPLMGWQPDQVAEYFKIHDLQPHPLVAAGYPSIGCKPCTSPVAPHEDPRAGRWRGSDKTECGIHLSADGKMTRSATVQAPRAQGCG